MRSAMPRAPSPILVPILALASAAGCSDDDPPLEPTYANVERLVVESCATDSSSCHGGRGTGSARLNFGAELDAGRPLTGVLVDVAACEYDLLDRVEPGDPDRSWLMVKLTHEFDADGAIVGFTPDPGWDMGGLEPRPDGTLPASVCPMTEDGVLTFGTNMPQSIGRPIPLAEREVTLIREWIALGAPGP